MGIREYTKKYCLENIKIIFRVGWRYITLQTNDVNELKYIKFVYDEHVRYYKLIFKNILDLAREAGQNIADKHEELIKK